MSNNQHISLPEAVTLTTSYRNNRPADFFISETFDAANVQQILVQPDCQYLRIYLGRKADQSVVAVLVGADSQQADILPSSEAVPAEAAVADNANGVILEDGYRCPEFCPKPSPLNP